MIRHLQRLGWLLIGIGIAGMVIGIILPSTGMGDAGQITPDELRGRIYFVAGDVEIDISVSEGKRISFYVLDWNNSMELVRTQSLESTTSVFVLENINEYEGVIPIPAQGLYSFISRSLNNETMSFRVDMYRVLPQRYIFYPSIPVMLIGVVLLQIARAKKPPSGAP